MSWNTRNVRGEEKMKKEPTGRRECQDVVGKDFERDPLNGDLHKNRQCLQTPHCDVALVYNRGRSHLQ